MKTLKQLASILFALMLGASLMGAPLTAFAAIEYDPGIASDFASAYVYDGDDLLTGSERSAINKQAQSVASTYKVAPYVVTVSDLDVYRTSEDYVKAFAKTYGLEDSAKNGCAILLLCVPESAYSLIALGDASDELSNATLSYIDSDISPYLGRADWAGAAETFVGDVEQTLSGKKANATSDIAYTAGTYVIDDYGLFSDADRNQLEATAQDLAAQYNMGVYLLVVDNMGSGDSSSTQRTNFATSFYRANKLGLGSGKDGILLVIAAGTRHYVTVAYGQGSHSFSDEGIDAMETAVRERLSGNDWYGGAQAYYDSIGEQLAYYDLRDRPWTEPDPISIVLQILAALGIPAAAAGAKIRGEKSAMKTAREQTQAANYLVRDSFQLVNSNDRFINTTLAVTPRPKESDHGGGGGGFGGGGWGGGGGGGFSSSGGGDF